MKRLLILLLALPLLLNAQISNKKKAFIMAQSGSSLIGTIDLPTPPDYGSNPVANLTDAVGASVSQTALNTSSGQSGPKTLVFDGKKFKAVKQK